MNIFSVDFPMETIRKCLRGLYSTRLKGFLTPNVYRVPCRVAVVDSFLQNQSSNSFFFLLSLLATGAPDFGSFLEPGSFS